MNKFLINLLFFFLPILAAIYPADLIISKYLAQSKYYAYGEVQTWKDIYDQNITADLLIYGSSRAWVQINPQIIEDSLHLTSYNLGIDGHNFWLQYLRHKEFLHFNKKPRHIIVSLDVFTLQKKKDLFNYQQFLPFLLWNDELCQYTSAYNGFSNYDYWMPMARYHHESEALFAAYASAAQIQVGPVRTLGYLGVEENWNDDLAKAKSKNGSFTIEIDSAILQLFDQFINECLHDSIGLTFVYSPEFIEGQNFVQNRKEIISKYQSIADQYHLPFLDYSGDTMSMKKEYYYNAEHLNKNGSTLFTLQLVNDLKRIPGMNTSPSSETGNTDLNNYTGSLYKDNYIWTGAMNFCWTTLCETIIHEPLLLQTEEPGALAMVKKFNNPVCSTRDLDEPSYYIKAGMGSKTVEAINRESRKIFPEKSFPDLNMSIGEDEFISYAYFYKKVAYEKPFTLTDMYFDNHWVSAFEAADDQKRTVEILKYENDDKFIIRLRLQSPSDELIVAKGYNGQDPMEVLTTMNLLGNNTATKLKDDDRFMMPLLHLSYRRDYDEMVGKALANPGFKGYIIGAMFENINFDMDEVGAKAESQAVISVERGAAPKKTGRYFIMDKPFWVIMKRSDSPRPYFLLGVNNNQFMQNK